MPTAVHNNKKRTEVKSRFSMSDSAIQDNLDTSIHSPPFLSFIACDRSDVPIPFNDKALRSRSILLQNMDRLSRTCFGLGQLLEILVGLVTDRGLVGVPGNSDFLERGCVEKNAHLLQQVDTIRFDLMTPGIEQQPFGHHHSEMIAGPLHPDITVEQGGPEQMFQVLLHLEERLL